MEIVTPIPDTIHEQVRVYYDMIRHMPVGVAIWRLEKGPKNVLRLICSNTQASQYVGAPLQVGRPIHEVLPNGLEVHRFLEEVVRTQRVSTLDKFRTFGRDVAVTAFPLHHEFVAVVLEAPKGVPGGKEEWATSIDSTGACVAICEGLRAVHCNEHFVSMMGLRVGEVSNCDVFLLLDQRSHQSRGVEELRRAIRDVRTHQVEIELDQRKWRFCTQPLMDGGKRSVLVAYRLAAAPPPSTFPILPNRDAFPSVPPKPALNMELIYSELVDNFPSAIAIVKIERMQEKMQFRIVALNKSARLISKHLATGKYFDEINTSPFEGLFVRTLIASAQEREGRVYERLALSGTHVTFTARTIPLPECIGISLEETKVVSPAPLNENVISVKRPYSEIDRGHPVLPSPKHPRPQTMPFEPAPLSAHQPFQPFSLPIPTRNPFDNGDMVLPFGSTLPKPILPPMQPMSSSSTSSDILGGSERDRLENRIFRNCVIGIACIDINGKFTAMNRAFSQTIGYQEQELMDRSVFPLLHHEDSEQAKMLVHQLIRGDLQTCDAPIRFVSKRMNSVWVLASFLLIRNTQGEPSSIVLQLQQPTRMRHYPEVLLSDPDVLRSTFRELAVGSAVLDPSTISSSSPSPRIVSANSAFCSVLGSTVSESELVGRMLIDVIYQDDKEKVVKAMREMFSSRILRHQMSVRTLPKVGPPAWAALSLASILDSKSLPILLVAQLQLVDKPFP